MRLSLAVSALVVLLAGCTSSTHVPPSSDNKPTIAAPTPVPGPAPKGERDSGPTTDIDVTHVPDAIPEPVKRTRAGNKNPYRVLGKTYRLLKDSQGYRETGLASWYGRKFHGRRTANGEVYDMYQMTAAHTRLPIPSYVKVTNLANNRTVVVKVNDRGPFHGKRIIDLSYAAAKKLGFHKKGVAKVLVEDVTPSTLAQKVKPAAAKPLAAPQLNMPLSTVAHAQAGTFIQVGAFKDSKRAHSLKTDIAGLVKQPVRVVDNAQDALYRVKVGPLDQASISSIEQRLQSAGLGYRVVSID